MEDISNTVEHLASEAASRMYQKLNASFNVCAYEDVRTSVAEVLYERNLKRFDYEMPITARDKAVLTINELVEKSIEPSVSNIAERINQLEGKLSKSW